MNDTRPSIQDTIRVLVVVDDQLIADIVRLTLTHGPYVTHQASAFPAAVSVLAECHPHLAVIDMDIGGPQILEQMGKGTDGWSPDPGHRPDSAWRLADEARRLRAGRG